MRFPPILLCLTMVVLLPISGLHAEQGPFWPQFHGPNRDNKSADTGLLKKWPEGGPKRIWTAQGVGYGYSSISIVDGLIYTAGNIDGKTVITAMDLDGKIRWQVENGPQWTKDKPGTRATPTIDGARLYHQSPLGNLVCLDAKTGKRAWGFNTLEKFGAKNITWALAESLLIDGDRVICCPGAPHAVVALDKKTGDVVWKSPSADGDKAGYSTPTLAEYQGLRMIFVMTSKAVIGVGADSGDLLWRVKHVSPWDENVLQPIYHDGHVFISTRTTGTLMLKLEVDGRNASVETVWKNKELDNHHGGVILLDGHLYGSTLGGIWVCLDWKTGERVYAVRGIAKGSITYADGMFYTYGEKGMMGLVRATPETPQPVSTFHVPSEGKGPYWTHPVVCGGRLYLRHGDFLYAYDVKANR